MKELSYHILDIANNSVRAKASKISIDIKEDLNNDRLTLTIIDNGKGIPQEILKEIKNPFITSRTTRKVGLGIPLLNDTCRNCNGALYIDSTIGAGTTLQATMELSHIDRPPMGNLVSTILTLLISDETIHIAFSYAVNDQTFSLSTQELKDILGDMPLGTPAVSQWIREYLSENIKALHNSE